MISGQTPPSLSSLTKATTGTEQLSEAEMTDGSGGGASPLHSIMIGAGSDAVGSTLSPIMII